MPAYFSIVLEFDRDDIGVNTVDELCFYLKHAGLRFRSGAFGAEKLSQGEITAHNQELLLHNFEPDPNEERGDSYFQSEFDVEGFSGARGFYLNNTPSDGRYEYVIVIPEEEIYEENEPKTLKKETAVRLLHLLEWIWHMPSIRTIQTLTEKCDDITPETEFKTGGLPQAHPYAVVTERQLKTLNTEGFEVKPFHIGGVMLTNKNYKFI
jgi:hypothetical protein